MVDHEERRERMERLLGHIVTVVDAFIPAFKAQRDEHHSAADVAQIMGVIQIALLALILWRVW